MKEKLFQISVLLCVGILALASCNEENLIATEVLMSDQGRITSPQATAEEIEQLASGNTAFAVELYQALSSEAGNLFFSPYSLSLALSMNYAGARGKTEAEIAGTLHFALARERHHTVFNALDLQIAALGQMAKNPFSLLFVASIWEQQGYQTCADYLDRLGENYGAGLRLLDFTTFPEEVRQTINSWIRQQTASEIKDLIPVAGVTAQTVMLLTNAVFFKAAWAEPFNPGYTQTGDFTLLNNSTLSVSMMWKEAYWGYVQGSNYQAVELPYDGSDVSLILILPEKGEFSDFEAGLDVERVEFIFEELTSTHLELTLPRFSYEASLSLKDPLSGLGMIAAFDASQADYSGMLAGCAFNGSTYNGGTYNGTTYNGGPLYISDLIHKTVISVNEGGIAVTAGTATVEAEVNPEQPVFIDVNRPFLFIILERKTRTILFMGRVVSPS